MKRFKTKLKRNTALSKIAGYTKQHPQLLVLPLLVVAGYFDVDTSGNSTVTEEYNKTPFNIIQNSDILTQEDLDKLIPLTQELKENFNKSQVFRMRTEMEVSVLNDIKFLTPNL